MIMKIILNAARRTPRPGRCWEEDMMPGLGLLLSQDIGVQRNSLSIYIYMYICIYIYIYIYVYIV